MSRQSSLDPQPTTAYEAFFPSSRLEEQRAAIATDLGLAKPDSLPLLRLPANRAGLQPLSAARIQRFRAHLEHVVELAFARPAPIDDGDEDGPASSDLDEARLFESACATCRGNCCHAGGDHAFLNIAAIDRYRRARPDADPDDVVDDYLSRLGKESYARACVYQERTGCRLPRSMRADICNSFLCTPLLQLRESRKLTGSKRVLVASIHGDRLLRLSLIDDTGHIDVMPRKPAGESA